MPGLLELGEVPPAGQGPGGDLQEQRGAAEVGAVQQGSGVLVARGLSEAQQAVSRPARQEQQELNRSPFFKE